MTAPGSPLAALEALAAVTHAQTPATPPERLRAALRTLRWSYGDLAVVLGCSASTPRYWCLGISPVPPSLLAWAERHAGALRDDPPPLVRLSIGGGRPGGGRPRKPQSS